MPASSVRFLVVSAALHGAAFAAAAAALPSPVPAPREVSVEVRWVCPPCLDVPEPPVDGVICGPEFTLDPGPFEQEAEFELPAVEFADAAAPPGSDDGSGGERPPFGVDARFGAGRSPPLGTEGGPRGGRGPGVGPGSGDGVPDPAVLAARPAVPGATPGPPTPPSSPARILDFAAPAYPEAARTAGDEGVVVLEGEVRADGSIGEVTVVRSSGSSLLDRAALSAVRSWRFAAALEQGVAVRSVLRLPPIRFRLD